MEEDRIYQIEQEIKEDLKSSFEKDFIDNYTSWKIKVERFNSMLDFFCDHERLKKTSYSFDEFCQVSLLAINDVIDNNVDYYSVYPSEIETLALKDSLMTSGKFTNDKFIDKLNIKKQEKFVSLQKKLANLLEEEMKKILIENKFPKKYKNFKHFLSLNEQKERN